MLVGKPEPQNGNIDWQTSNRQIRNWLHYPTPLKDLSEDKSQTLQGRVAVIAWVFPWLCLFELGRRGVSYEGFCFREFLTAQKSVFRAIRTSKHCACSSLTHFVPKRGLEPEGSLWTTCARDLVLQQIMAPNAIIMFTSSGRSSRQSSSSSSSSSSSLCNRTADILMRLTP